METALAFLKLVLLGFVTLFPPVNPVGTALLINPYLERLPPAERRAAARRIAWYCFLTCIVAFHMGGWIFGLFGISVPVVQVAGGLLICQMGWKLLNSEEGTKGSDHETSVPVQRDVEGILFYPLAFPITTGAGTISVLFTLNAHERDSTWSSQILNGAAVSVAILAMSITIYLCYAYTPAVLRKLGARGGQIMNRLSAFLVFCVGIHIATSGIQTLVRSFMAETAASVIEHSL